MNDKATPTGESKRLLHRLRAKVRASLWLRVALFITAATATVIGCGWAGTEHSVRFNSYQTEREMGQLPPLPTLANGKTELREQWNSEDDWGDSEADISTKNVAELNALWDKAEAAEQSGDLHLTIALLRDYLARTSFGRDFWISAEYRQGRRNSAIDRLDALAALKHGAKAEAVQSYLAARSLYDEMTLDEVEGALAAVPSSESLRDNVAYLRAGLLYRMENYVDAASAFGKLARQFPRSEKREAALYMAALSLMKTSKSFNGTFGEEAHLQAGNRNSAGDAATLQEASPTPAAECCDDAWREARAAFKHLLGEFPRGRYNADARGWIAYLLLRAGDRAGALVEYYRLLGDQRDQNARVEAAFSLTFVRHHATDEEMRRVESELADEPAPALAYAYHNVYNYAVNPGCPFEYFYSDNGWDAKRDKARVSAIQRAELSHVAAFASSLMQRYPQARISGGFAVRVAGANLELGENLLAAQQSRRALLLNVRGEERARALWIEGVAEHRLHDYANARRTLSTLIAENPQGQFTEGARRLLAMAAEDAGDLDAALEQYLSLKYDTDVAYFIDVLMSPEQLEGFINRHPDAEQHDELLYALGIRHMREGRWDAARVVFARVRTTYGPSSAPYYASTTDCAQPPPGKRACFDPKDIDTGPGVTARLLLRDVRTIDDLERLERQAAQAEGDEAQAEALYQLASYQYQASTLLFYNPLAWKSGRFWNLSELHANGRYRATNEAAVLWRHMQEHEPIARALSLYLGIVRNFPQTRAARDALYTAAVCHERLANYNEYWRGMYAIGQHAGDRMVTYRDVRIAYPDYQLPRATYGWEPSTRTVRGGPGWAAPPKPQPRLTWRQHLKLSGERLWDWLGVFLKEQALGWLVAGLAVLSALFASFFAARARKLLHEHIGRRRVCGRGLRRWLNAYRAGQLKDTLSDEAQKFARLTAHQSLRLVLHPRGRLLLALNLLAHALLIALLVVIVQTLSPG